MSPIALAEAIDLLAETGSAFVVESEGTVTVSGLSVENLISLDSECEVLKWSRVIYDRENGICSNTEEFDQDFVPYRIVINKPEAADNLFRVLTNTAFSYWLDRGHVSKRWQVARMTGSFATQMQIIESWDALPVAFSEAPVTKSPRNLVREYGAKRLVPPDIRPWLAEGISEDAYELTVVQAWVKRSVSALMFSIADEIDADDGGFKFRGPPRLKLPSLDLMRVPRINLSHATFTALQDSAKWVFESEREAEMRHILLAAELARCGIAEYKTEKFLDEHIANALESAKIAYQMALSDTSRDTLKSLTELRKSITEETSKLSELSRQLMTAIASALALGIGLIAARVTSAAPATIISAVMVVVFVYVSIVIISGIHFIGLQRQLRKEWQPKLYRFLPVDDYKKMVSNPAVRAERSFFWVACLGWISVLVLAIICLWPDVIWPETNLAKGEPARIDSSGVGASNQSSLSTPEAGKTTSSAKGP